MFFWMQGLLEKIKLVPRFILEIRYFFSKKKLEIGVEMMGLFALVKL
jgi:hypothetical protein